MIYRRVRDAIKAEDRDAQIEKRDGCRWLTGTVLLGLLSLSVGGVSAVLSLRSAWETSQRVERDVGQFAPLVERANRVSGLTKGEYEEDTESLGAGSGLNPQGTQDLTPVFLEAGFPIDPHELSLSGGGNVDASYLEGRGTCVGYVDQAPDAQLEWSGTTEELRIFFTADAEVDDATLLVWGETENENEWFCNDDSSSLNPLVALKTPQAGSYHIWVGSFERSRSISGRLSITELDLEPASWFDTLANGF